MKPKYRAAETAARRGSSMFMLLALAASAASAQTPAPAGAEGEAGFEIPEPLKPWAEPTYTQRYFLRVEAPPLAGAVNLQNAPHVASVYLPLRSYDLAQGEEANDEDAKLRVEHVLLLDDQGEVQPVLVRPVARGREVEVAFGTRSGQRRYALYAGANEGRAARASPTTFRTTALMVRRQVQQTPKGKLPSAEKPMTFAAFEELGRNLPRTGVGACANIDDPEPPEEHLRRAGPGYTSVFEGFLRAPLPGRYGFAVFTYGAACLVVDGYEVCTAGAADPKRGTFDLKGEIELGAGTHRVVLYHIQAGDKMGVRLFWKPPFAEDFGVAPAQAFPRGLPAVVARAENVAGRVEPFLHVERLAQFRVRRHRGPALEKEWVLYFAQAVAEAAPGGELAFEAFGAASRRVPAAGGCAWMPAGAETKIAWQGEGAPAEPLSRTVLFPLEREGGRNVADLCGALELKAASTFLYSDETGQIHFETQLAPLPVIHEKNRVERGPPIPAPQPMGQYRVAWSLQGPDGPGEILERAEATPALDGRCKIRVPLPPERFAEASKSGQVRLVASLSVGGVPVERLALRLLHARAPWPAGVFARLDGLGYAEPAAGGPGGEPEQALVVVPREDEADYRRFRLREEARALDASEILFLGDPLVEAPAGADPEAPLGLAARLARAYPEKTWSARVLPGPSRGRFVFRLLEAAEAAARKREGGLPESVVVSVGGGDAYAQTPLHDFERGLDVLVDRLRLAGTRRILFLGVVPEPGRTRQGEPYQKRWAEIVRAHHLEGFDIFTLWTEQSDWLKHFALDPDSDKAAYGPAPNVQALDGLVEALRGK
ncbi:MAG: hypothetical protein M5U26_14240 [Planctomycetota bacterium]|nr:hypothetical protein [Planctomycetota bacterium]